MFATVEERCSRGGRSRKKQQQDAATRSSSPLGASVVPRRMLDLDWKVVIAGSGPRLTEQVLAMGYAVIIMPRLSSSMTSFHQKG